MLHACIIRQDYILKLHNNRYVPNRLSNQLPEVRLYRRGLDRGRNYRKGEVPPVRVPRRASCQLRPQEEALEGVMNHDITILKASSVLEGGES